MSNDPWADLTPDSVTQTDGDPWADLAPDEPDTYAPAPWSTTPPNYQPEPDAQDLINSVTPFVPRGISQSPRSVLEEQVRNAGQPQKPQYSKRLQELSSIYGHGTTPDHARTIAREYAGLFENLVADFPEYAQLIEREIRKGHAPSTVLAIVRAEKKKDEEKRKTRARAEVKKQTRGITDPAQADAALMATASIERLKAQLSVAVDPAERAALTYQLKQALGERVDTQALPTDTGQLFWEEAIPRGEAAGRAIAQTAIPSTAGGLGMVATARLAANASPVARVAAPLLVGGIAALGVGQAQNLMAKEVLGDEKYAEWVAQLSQDREKYPGTVFAAEQVGNLAVGRINPAMHKLALTGAKKVLAGEVAAVTQAEKQAIGSAAFGGSTGATLEFMRQIGEGQIRPLELAAAFLINAGVNDMAGGRTPDVPLPRATDGVNVNLPESELMPPPRSTTGGGSPEPLGVSRPPVIDEQLTRLSDDAFDAARRSATAEVDVVERRMDADPNASADPAFRADVAAKQDRYAALENEAYRRELTDMHVDDVARELRRSDAGTPDGAARLMILMRVIDERGIRQDLAAPLRTIAARSPDMAEVLAVKLRDAAKPISQPTATATTGREPTVMQPTVAAGKNTLTTEAANAGSDSAFAGVMNSTSPEQHLGAFRSWIGKYFTSRKNLPEQTFQRLVQARGENAAANQQAAFAAKDLRTAMRKNYGWRVPVDAELNVTKALRGEIPIDDLPLPIREKVVAMRDHMDSLSDSVVATMKKQQAGLDPNGESYQNIQQMIDKIEGNKGSYVTRSYRVFDDPKYAKKVAPQIRDQAFNELKAENPNMPDEEINGLLDSILSAHEKGARSILELGQKVGSRNLSPLMKRKDISPAMRAFLGEYNDPYVNYLRTVHKVSDLVAKTQFLRDVATQGEGKFLFRKPTGQHHASLASEGSKTMDPLGEFYTTPEIADAFKTMQQSEPAPEWLKLLMRGSGISKAMNTIGSLQTQVRNVTANPLLALRQGNIRIGKTGDAVTGILADAGATNESWRNAWIKYTKLGVVGEGTNAGEVRQALKDAMATPESAAIAPESGGVAKEAGRLAVKGATKAYQYGDDIFKIYNYENELAALRRAKPNAPIEELEREAARIVRDTQPTYSMTGKAIDSLSRAPVIGSFVKFPAEIVRTEFNTWAQILREMKDPALRGIGTKRLGGLMSAWAVSLGAPSAAMRALNGTNSEDDDAARRFLPEWSKNSRITVEPTDQPGVMKYTDDSYTNPLTILQKPITALLNTLKDGNYDFASVKQGTLDAVTEFLSPFVSEDVLATRIFDIKRNKKPDGRKVYNEADDEFQQLSDQAQYVMGAFVPGTIKSANKIKLGMASKADERGKTYDAGIELKAMLTGNRSSKLDVGRNLEFNFYKQNDRLRQSLSEFNRFVESDAELDGPAIEEAYAKYEKRVRRAVGEMRKDVEAARKLGVPETKLRSAEKLLQVQLRDVAFGRADESTFSPSVSISDRAMSKAGRAALLRKILKGRIKSGSSFGTMPSLSTGAP